MAEVVNKTSFEFKSKSIKDEEVLKLAKIIRRFFPALDFRQVVDRAKRISEEE